MSTEEDIAERFAIAMVEKDAKIEAQRLCISGMRSRLLGIMDYPEQTTRVIKLADEALILTLDQFLEKR